MIIKEITGDIIQEWKDGNIDVLIHGCNCFNIMGAGLALQVAKEFPIVQAVDQSTKVGDATKLGKFSGIDFLKEVGNVKIDEKYEIQFPNDITEKDRVKSWATKQVIINLYTQYYPGKNFEYGALVTGLQRINKTFKKSGLIIGFPQIGCGIGGGDWTIVKSLIDSHTPNLKVVIVNYEKQIKKEEKIDKKSLEILDKD